MYCQGISSFSAILHDYQTKPFNIGWQILQESQKYINLCTHTWAVGPVLGTPDLHPSLRVLISNLWHSLLLLKTCTTLLLLCIHFNYFSWRIKTKLSLYPQTFWSKCTSGNQHAMTKVFHNKLEYTPDNFTQAMKNRWIVKYWWSSMSERV